MRGFNISLLKVIIRLLVSAALLSLVLRSIDLAALWQRVRGMNLAWMVLALVAIAFM